MLIFLKTDGNSKGDAEIITPEVVYQGSDNVTDITVVAPFSAQTSLSIGFILPNGLYWFTEPLDADDPQSGGNYAPMAFVAQDFTIKANVWKYTLPRSVTEMPGTVQIAINAVTRINTDGNTTVDKGNCTSFLCAFTVSESVVPLPPTSAPTADVYELLRQYLSYLDGRTANVPNLVASIQKSGGNSFTFTDNKGIVSAPITLGEIDYDPTYVGVASVINIPDTAWQQPAGGGAYSVVITAAQHGQMQDGATAHDLWVAFDKTADNVISGAYQGYTVSESGDITLTATTPVNMTVRVWNGKGLIDQTAREDLAAETARATAEEARLQSEITAETSRAETAESGLQSQIDEIVQSGVDLTARAQIAAETQRAESAEQKLNDKITAIQSDYATISYVNSSIATAITTALNTPV